MEDADYMPDANEKLEVHKDCEIKQGFLGLVTSIVTQDNKMPILTAKASFVVLNKKSLSFFKKENMNSLVKSVEIAHLKPNYFPNTWKGLFCWQLVEASKSFLI